MSSDSYSAVDFFTTKQSVESFTASNNIDQQIETDKSVLFWKPPCLGGNWTICPFWMDNQEFNCAEQALMWLKARDCSDDKTAALILTVMDPKQHKELGRQITGFDQKRWDVKKYKFMLNVLWHKFSQNRDYVEALLATGNKQLVEASKVDPIWGIKMGAKEFIKKGEDMTNVKGQNLLGKALMEVRTRLRQELSSTGPNNLPCRCMHVGQVVWYRDQNQGPTQCKIVAVDTNHNLTFKVLWKTEPPQTVYISEQCDHPSRVWTHDEHIKKE